MPTAPSPERAMPNKMKRKLTMLRRIATWILPLLLLASGLAAAQVSYVDATTARAKLSTDLAASISAPSVANVNWARDTSSGRLVKVLVLGINTADPEL